MEQVARTRLKSRGRAYPRYALDLSATLMTRDNQFLGPAKIMDMSGGGARLFLPDRTTTLPDQFVMVLCSSSGPRRNCSIVWQTDKMLGVRFV